MISLFRDITSICRKQVDLRITKATTLFHALIISLHDCKNIYIFINYVIRVFEEKPRYICTIWTFASMIKLRYILFVFYFHIWKISNSLFHCVLFSLKKIKLGQFRDRHRVVKVARVGWNCWFVSQIVPCKIYFTSVVLISNNNLSSSRGCFYKRASFQSIQSNGVWIACNRGKMCIDCENDWHRSRRLILALM